MNSSESERKVLDGGTTLAPNIDWLRKQKIALENEELQRILIEKAKNLGLLNTNE